MTLGWCGLLRWWSFVTLGRWFTVVLRTSEDQPVIDRGPYRLVGHPSYSGLLLALAGCAAALGNIVTGPVAVVLVLAAVVYRIRIEERALVQALGDRCMEFGRTRARLVPHVW